MVRVLLYLVLVGIFACGAVWVVNRPGDIIVNWQGYRIETSVAAALALVAIVAGLSVVLWNVMRWIMAGPEAFALFRRNRRRTKGYEAIARGVVAVGTGDARRAGKEAGEARKLLGKEPLTLVLAAQAAQLAGDRAGAETAFRAMTDQPETRSLGLRGLFIEAERRGDRAAAKKLAEEAARQSPQTPWAGQALFEFQCAEHDWEGALSTLERLGANRLIEKPDLRRRRAVLLTAQAMDGSASDPSLAIKRAREAHSLAPDFPPPAALAARLLAEQGDHKKAMKIVEAAWAKATHPDLAEVYVHVRPADAARDKLKRAKALSERSGDDPEGLIAVARAAIAAREIETARVAIAKLLSVRPTARACLLMAELEEIEHTDGGRSREWLGRALRAPRDPAWVADGVSSDIWAPVSPATGRFDAFVWKIPVEDSRPKLAAETWLDQAPLDQKTISALPVAAETAPAPVPAAAAPVKPAPAKPAAAKRDPARTAPAEVEIVDPNLPRAMPTLLDSTPAVVDASLHAVEVNTAANDKAPDKTATVEATKPVSKAVAKSPTRGAQPARPTAAVFPLSRAPDDPGPVNGSEPGEPAQAGPSSRPTY